jgi:hypothetical protein
MAAQGNTKDVSLGKGSASYVQRTGGALGRFLRKLLLDCSRLHSMPSNVVRRVLFFRSSGELLCKPLGKQRGLKRKRPTRQGMVGKGLGEQATSGGQGVFESAGR